MTSVAIRLARPEEIDALVAIDDDACTLDAEAGLVMAFDASHPFVVGERARWVAAIAGGRLEVAETPDGALIGFAARSRVDGEPYLDQREVLPDPDRRIAMVHPGGVTSRGSRVRS